MDTGIQYRWSGEKPKRLCRWAYTALMLSFGPPTTREGTNRYGSMLGRRGLVG